MTKLLLDTCTLIQWATNPKQLKDEARIAISSGRSLVYVSAATAWEIAIKTKLGKLEKSPSIFSLLQDNRFTELPISILHTQETNLLPMIHRDPFDRLLVAQARSESMTLVTRDPEIHKYDVETLAA
jgi:PIN domain nuclease of toxin-antitoxin system